MHTLLVILALRRDVGHVSSAIREDNVIGCLSRIVREAYSIDDKILKVGMDTVKDLGIVLKEDNNEL